MGKWDDIDEDSNLFQEIKRSGKPCREMDGPCRINHEEVKRHEHLPEDDRPRGLDLTSDICSGCRWN